MNDDTKMLELIYKELVALRQEIAYIKGKQDGMQDRLHKIASSPSSPQFTVVQPVFDDRIHKIDSNTVFCQEI